jgi:hypothetical protein
MATQPRALRTNAGLGSSAWEERMHYDDGPVTENVTPVAYQMRLEVDPDFAFADELCDDDIITVEVVA